MVCWNMLWPSFLEPLDIDSEWKGFKTVAGGGRITSVSIRLPHNSLLVCWEGFQEFWRHEVPKDKSLKPHSISGCARLNFTFRQSATGIFDPFP